MNVKTWDVLNRRTGYVIETGFVGKKPRKGKWKDRFGTDADPLMEHEVAYCRETGEVVYW